MPVAPLHPGVHIKESPSHVRPITGVPTSSALFIGWAPKGPTDRALRISSFADFGRLFGAFDTVSRRFEGLDHRSLLGYAIKHFFENGGADAYVIRVADVTAVTARCDLGDLHIEASSPGGWANALTVRLVQRADDATRFSLDVLDEGDNNAVLESFANLSMDAADPSSVERIVNGRSALLANLAASTMATPNNGSVLLGASTEGDDGTVIGPADAASTFRDAVVSLFDVDGIADRIDLVNLVCVPGLTDPATVALLQQRARQRRAFLIVDADPHETVQTLADTLGVMTGADASNSAIYFPWVQAPDPRQSGALRLFPPSGFVAGVIARTDASRGVWKAPAGREANLVGATGLAITIKDAENGQLSQRGVNCLRTLPVLGNVVWGARTLHGDDDRGSQWKYVPVRRTALFLKESLYRGTRWAVFEANDELLWAQIQLDIEAFMQELFRQGAFQGTTPDEAYFVKCGPETTTQADIDLGIVNILVGFAPLKPGEFVVLRIQQMAGDIPT